MPYKTKRRTNGEGIDPLFIQKNIYKVMTNQLTKNNKKSRPLYYGEMHPTTFSNGQFAHSNFLGPGTRIDLPEVRNFPPYNPADAAAKIHDITYEEIQKLYDKKKITAAERERMIREADFVLIDELRKLSPMEFRDAGLLGMSTKVKLEDLAPSLVRTIAGPKYFGKK